MTGAQSTTCETERTNSTWKLSSKVLAIAGGEGMARGTNLLLAVFVARQWGVRAAGAWALAQGLALYLMQGTDFGFRHVGARLVAQEPNALASVVRFIQKRRVALAVAMSAVGYAYGRFGPVPEDTRTLVSLFALATFGYGLSLDWLAWGTERFGIMSGWRAAVTLVGAGLTLAGALWLHWGMLALPAAFAIAYLLADSWLWFGWAQKLCDETEAAAQSPAIPDWGSTAYLGIALLVNQAFNSIDTMMLGGMTDSRQTGLYSAAYKLLLLALASYYLLMQALYPGLAAIPASERGLRRLRSKLVLAGTVGLVVAAVLFLLKGGLIALLFGPAFAPSAALAGPLLAVIPMDFIVAVFLTVLVAWDHPRRVLAATGTAVVCNVALNCVLIPRFGAMGAAWATPLSYVPFLAVLFGQMMAIDPARSAKEAGLEARGNAQGESRVRFSLVLATLERVETLERTFESLAKQKFQDFEIIVVDQNADQRLSPIAARWRDKFDWVYLHAAPGVSQARNLGIQAAKGEIVTFPDDDGWYPQDLLAQVDSWFTDHPGYSLLSICAKDEDGNEVSSRWPRHSCELDRWSGLRACSTFCLFVKRQALVASNGFDPKMGPGSGTPFAAAEDLDLALRVLARGGRGWFEKTICAGHPAKTPSNAPPSRARGYGRGFGYLLRKHNFGPETLLLHALRALAGIVRAALLFRRREAIFHWNSFKGRIEGYWGFPDRDAKAANPGAVPTTVSIPE